MDWHDQQQITSVSEKLNQQISTLEAEKKKQVCKRAKSSPDWVCNPLNKWLLRKHKDACYNYSLKFELDKQLRIHMHLHPDIKLLTWTHKHIHLTLKQASFTIATRAPLNHLTIKAPPDLPPFPLYQVLTESIFKLSISPPNKFSILRSTTYKQLHYLPTITMGKDTNNSTPMTKEDASRIQSSQVRLYPLHH